MTGGNNLLSYRNCVGFTGSSRKNISKDVGASAEETFRTHSSPRGTFGATLFFGW